MIIEVVGVGCAFAADLGNASVLVWDDFWRSAVLFDCGYNVFPDLRKKELKEKRDIISKIDSVFVSHLHDDHCGSLGTLLEYRFWALNKNTKITSIVPFSEIFKGRMDNFNASKIYAGEDKRITVIPTVHAKNFPAAGAYFDGVLFSGDTAVSMLGSEYAKQSKIIIHEIGLQQNQVHVGIGKLIASASKEILAKTYGIHYSNQERERLFKIMEESGFAGLLWQNQIIKIK